MTEKVLNLENKSPQNGGETLKSKYDINSFDYNQWLKVQQKHLNKKIRRVPYFIKFPNGALIIRGITKEGMHKTGISKPSYITERYGKGIPQITTRQGKHLRLRRFGVCWLLNAYCQYVLNASYESVVREIYEKRKEPILTVDEIKEMLEVLRELKDKKGRNLFKTQLIDRELEKLKFVADFLSPPLYLNYNRDKPKQMIAEKHKIQDSEMDIDNVRAIDPNNLYELMQKIPNERLILQAKESICSNCSNRDECDEFACAKIQESLNEVKNGYNPSKLSKKSTPVFKDGKIIYKMQELKHSIKLGFALPNRNAIIPDQNLNDYDYNELNERKWKRFLEIYQKIYEIWHDDEIRKHIKIFFIKQELQGLPTDYIHLKTDVWINKFEILIKLAFPELNDLITKITGRKNVVPLDRNFIQIDDNIFDVSPLILEFQQKWFDYISSS